MTKKPNISGTRSGALRRSGFDPETSPYFVPTVLALLFVLLAILFGSFLFSDKMLYMSDQIQAGVFFRSLLVNSVDAHGSVPSWNPYIFGGMPYVDAFHGDIFYPLSILKFFGSLYRMLGMNLFLHIFLAGLFMYFCGRQFALSKVAALMAGACYMFAGYLISLVSPGHDGKIFVTALFPLVMLFLDRGFERKPFFNFSLLGLVIGLVILTPHPQMAYFTLWAVSAYTLYRLVRIYLESKKLMNVLRPGLLVGYAVVVGLLISAVQFYPGYFYTTHFSPRADTKQGWDWATSWSMHQEEAFSLLIPEFAGTTTQKVETYYWGKNPFKDNSESAGVVTIFVALIGLFFSKRRGAYFFGGLALFALIYALGGTTPLFYLFFYTIPKVASLRAPSMIMFLFLFSASMLAGMGVQSLVDRQREASAAREKRLQYLLIGFPLFSFFMAIAFSIAGKGMLSAWCSVFYSEAATTEVQQGFSKLDVAFRNLPAIQSGAWLAFLFVAVAAVLIWLYRAGKAGAGVLAALVLVPAIDGARFNRRFVDVFDQSQNWSETPLTQMLAKDTSSFRALNLTKPNDDMLPFHGFEVVVGYHGNQLRWYDDLLGGPQLANVQNPRVLNLLGTKYLVVPAGMNIPEGYFGANSVKSIGAFGQVQLLRNENAYPRVYLVNQYRVFHDRKDIYPLVVTGGENLRQVAYLEEEPEIPVVQNEIGSDSAWVISHAADSVVIGVACSANRLLVLTDTYYDAWQASVDGKPVRVQRSYGALRAIVAPSGARQVTFRYNSSRYSTGRIITWLTSLYLLSIIGFTVVRQRLEKRKEQPEKE